MLAGHIENTSVEQLSLWERIKWDTSAWLKLYRYHAFRHSMIRELLFSEDLVTFVEKDGVQIMEVTEESYESWIRLRNTRAASCSDSDITESLSGILDQLQSGMSLLAGLDQDESSNQKSMPSRESTPPTAENSDVQCRVNGISISLHFKNSGNNDINDIETYLQEKLDVLEFLQLDLNKGSPQISPRASVPTSRIFAPKICKIRKQIDPVQTSQFGAWDEDPSMSIMDQSSVSSSGPIRSTQVSCLSRGGFFIGTPTSRDMSILSQDVSLFPHDDSLSPDESSRFRWETGSSRSRSRNRSVSSAYSRKRSCSVTSNSSSKPWPVRRMGGMLGFRRFDPPIRSQDDDMSNDENSLEANPPHTSSPENSKYVATGWWN